MLCSSIFLSFGALNFAFSFALPTHPHYYCFLMEQVLIIDSSDDESSSPVLIVPIQEAKAPAKHRKKEKRKENFKASQVRNYAKQTEASFLKTAPAAIPANPIAGSHRILIFIP